MIRKLTTFSLAGFILLAACKKSSSDSKPNTPVADSVLIIGKWHPVRNASYFYSSSGAYLDSAAEKIGSGDYFTFTGTQVFSYEAYAPGNSGPLYDTVSYLLSGKNFIEYSPGQNYDTSQISKLTADSLMITAKYSSSDPYNGGPAIEADTFTLIKIK